MEAYQVALHWKFLTLATFTKWFGVIFLIQSSLSLSNANYNYLTLYYDDNSQNCISLCKANKRSIYLYLSIVLTAADN